MQFDDALRNAILNQIEVEVGTAPKLQVRTGGAPANCAAADSGTLLVEISLPSDWLANAAAGVKALAGVWSGLAVATGTPGHYRVKDTAGTITRIQGTCGVGSGELQLDAAVGSIGQTVLISTWNKTAGNA